MANKTVKKKEKTLTTVSDIFPEVKSEIKEVVVKEEPEKEIVEEVSESLIEEKEEKQIVVNPGIPSKQPLVRIKPNKDHTTYIGDRYYYLTKGKIETVPQQVKDILNKIGILDPI